MSAGNKNNLVEAVKAAAKAEGVEVKEVTLQPVMITDELLNRRVEGN